VQEDERLLSEDDEDCVSQFWHFGEDEGQSPKAAHAVRLDETAKNTFLASAIVR